MRRIVVPEFGGAEVLRFVQGPNPACQPKTLLVRVVACGVNFIDIYHRTGLYKNPLPYALGQEGAGTVTEVGEDVSEFAPGDRVAWTGVSGSYGDCCLVPADRAVRIPEGINERTAAAIMLQGMTAHYLTRSTYRVRPMDVCLVHAAAGGVGLLLCQILHHIGATVIGTVSTADKAALASAVGADEVVIYTEADFEAEVRRITGGRGAQVAYDSVGRTTFEKSLNCLAPRGMLVLYGQSSGPVPPIDPAVLAAKGSLFLTRPSLFHYVAARAELLERARDVFAWITSGALNVLIGATFPLEQAAEAHRQLEGRKTTGKVLLIP